MASPQTRNLKTANGGKVAPQHYNDAMGDFEYSKGSDGALHTKVINQPSVTLVDKNGNPIDSGNKLPVDVAFPTEQAVKDADVLAKLADIEAKIQATNDRLNQTLNTQLTGSSVLETVTVTTTALAAGANFIQPNVDIVANNIAATGLLVYSDQPVTVELICLNSIGASLAAPTEATFRTGSAYLVVPPTRPLGVSYRWRITNNSGTNMTVLNVIELRYHFLPHGAQNLRATLAYNCQIRDTISHSGVANSGNMYRLRRTLFGGGKTPIFVKNDHDQALTISIFLAISNAMTATLGTKSVPAASSIVITNQDFPGLDVPAEEIYLGASASVAPTTGALYAYCDTVVGGTI